MKKLLTVLLAMFMCLSLCACGGENVTDGGQPSDDGSVSDNGDNSNVSADEAPQPADKNGTKVVYVPLDNRPVNLDRAEYLAAAVGIDLIMPAEELVSNTTTDTKTSDGSNPSDQGNPKDILEWLKTDLRVQEAEYFVLSLDQMFSGGLVGSRDPFYDTDDTAANFNSDGSLLKSGEYVLSSTEKDIANYIIKLADGSKKVVLFDTVMRLATTGSYGDANLATYNSFRDGFASTARKSLSGDELTIDNIVAGYMYDFSGKPITVSAEHEGVKNSYVLARERKLRLIDYLLNNKDTDGDGKTDITYDLLDNIAGLYIGVDDSKAKENIQTNEMKYVTEKLINGAENALLFAGADELGLMGISDVATMIYGEINVNLQYFGEGKDFIADDYDPGILSDSVNAHIDAVGGKIVSENADMDVLVLTRAASGAQHELDVKSLCNKLEENLENNIPTCVIDASAYAGYGTLAKEMMARGLDVAEILGFSAWNTVGNSVGIALSNATARCSYLKNSETVTSESHKGFMKAITFSMVKDNVYKLGDSNEISFQNGSKTAGAKGWTELINGSPILVSVENGVGVEGESADVTVSDLTFPWNRSFEAMFVIGFGE